MRKTILVLFSVFLVMATMFDQVQAARVVRFFENLKHTKGRFYGQPFTLLPWEDGIIRDVYGTVNEAGVRLIKYVYVEIPKKNGKSELVAGAGLYHTFADGEVNGEVYGCAADRSQASIVFDVAVDMIDQVPALKKRTKLTLSQKLITDKVTGTFYKVVSAEAYTKHGLNISACIFDELHAQPNRGLWDVMTFGAGDARLQPIWWIITTAGDDPDRASIGWEIHEKAEGILRARQAGNEDEDMPTWYPVIFNYEGDDIYNEANWAKANPSLGETISIEAVREAAKEARKNPANERLFRWLRLNQWPTYKLTSWLPLELFDKTTGAWSRAEQLGKECYLGLDLSSTTDLTSLAVVFPPQGKQLDWRTFWHCWLPEAGLEQRVKNDKIPYDKWAEAGYLTLTKGDAVDYTVIYSTILEVVKFYKVLELGFDRAMAAMLVQLLEQKGLICVDIPQTFMSLSDPINQVEAFLRRQAGMELEDGAAKIGDDGETVSTETVVLSPGVELLVGKMTHELNPLARWTFGNTSVAKNGQGYVKFVKQTRGKGVDRTKRIDPMIALVNAMARARFYKGSVDISAQILDEEWGM